MQVKVTRIWVVFTFRTFGSGLSHHTACLLPLLDNQHNFTSPASRLSSSHETHSILVSSPTEEKAETSEQHLDGAQLLYVPAAGDDDNHHVDLLHLPIEQSPSHNDPSSTSAIALSCRVAFHGRQNWLHMPIWIWLRLADFTIELFFGGHRSDRSKWLTSRSSQ